MRDVMVHTQPSLSSFFFIMESEAAMGLFDHCFVPFFYDDSTSQCNIIPSDLNRIKQNYNNEN